MTNNTYFEKLRAEGETWEAARVERQKRKDQIIRDFGWDSEELKAWKEEDEAAKFPYSQGAVKAYRAWAQSKERGEDEVEMSDHLWDYEIKDFAETLRIAGIETFGYTGQSTACMDNLHDLAEAGCTLMGLTKITRHEQRWGNWDEDSYEVRGIRFSTH